MDTITGSNPVLTTVTRNRESTFKNPIDSLERQAIQSGGGIGNATRYGNTEGDGVNPISGE